MLRALLVLAIAGLSIAGQAAAKVDRKDKTPASIRWEYLYAIVPLEPVFRAVEICPSH